MINNLTLQEVFKTIEHYGKEYCSGFRVVGKTEKVIKLLEDLGNQKDKNAFISFSVLSDDSTKKGVLEVHFKLKNAIKKSSVFQEVHLHYFCEFTSPTEYELEMF